MPPVVGKGNGLVSGLLPFPILFLRGRKDRVAANWAPRRAQRGSPTPGGGASTLGLFADRTRSAVSPPFVNRSNRDGF